ncbi:hypothetical protein ASZ90_018343 [hydrocarbon metagenome]|uniref:Uncharacterized protein n=1 Tax=hydrocarbon metagenome TaxID=938273 RepID=A0A0W8E6S8_9ZZZZ
MPTLNIQVLLTIEAFLLIAPKRLQKCISAGFQLARLSVRD